MNKYSDSILTIDLGAIAKNYQLLKKKSGKAEVAAVVKANAYGLGSKEVAKALTIKGCKSFFVATLDEAMELRGILKKESIYVFHGLCPGQEDIFTQKNLIPVLNDFYQVELWNKQARRKEKKLPAIVHFDTGMNRLGINSSEAKKFFTDKNNLLGINLKYVMSHLACAGENSAMNKEQLDLFTKIKKLSPTTPATLANSAGIFLGKSYCFDMVRAGVALYGVNPTQGKNPMNNVVTLMSRILQVRQINSEQTVGYGATRTVPAGTVLATIPLGYADGYMRSLGNKACAVVNGKQVPVVGRISMDMTVLDITKLPKNKVETGTEVQLIGGHVPVDLVAKQAGTIGYEILTNLGCRYRRRYING